MKKYIDKLLLEFNFNNKEDILNIIKYIIGDKVDFIDVFNKNFPQVSWYIYLNFKVEEKGINLNEYDFEKDFKNKFYLFFII